MSKKFSDYQKIESKTINNIESKTINDIDVQKISLYTTPISQEFNYGKYGVLNKYFNDLNWLFDYSKYPTYLNKDYRVFMQNSSNNSDNINNDKISYSDKEQLLNRNIITQKDLHKNSFEKNMIDKFIDIKNLLVEKNKFNSITVGMLKFDKPSTKKKFDGLVKKLLKSKSIKFSSKTSISDLLKLIGPVFSKYTVCNSNRINEQDIIETGLNPNTLIPKLSNIKNSDEVKIKSTIFVLSYKNQDLKDRFCKEAAKLLRDNGYKLTSPVEIRSLLITLTKDYKSVDSQYTVCNSNRINEQDIIETGLNPNTLIPKLSYIKNSDEVKIKSTISILSYENPDLKDIFYKEAEKLLLNNGYKFTDKIGIGSLLNALSKDTSNKDSSISVDSRYTIANNNIIDDQDVTETGFLNPNTLIPKLYDIKNSDELKDKRTVISILAYKNEYIKNIFYISAKESIEKVGFQCTQSNSLIEITTLLNAIERINSDRSLMITKDDLENDYEDTNYKLLDKLTNINNKKSGLMISSISYETEDVKKEFYSYAKLILNLKKREIKPKLGRITVYSLISELKELQAEEYLVENTITKNCILDDNFFNSLILHQKIKNIKHAINDKKIFQTKCISSLIYEDNDLKKKFYNIAEQYVEKSIYTLPSYNGKSKVGHIRLYILSRLLKKIKVLT